MKTGITFTEPLPSKDRGIHMETHRLMGGIYEVAIWMGSAAMICISTIKTGSGFQKIIGEGLYSQAQHGDQINLLLFFPK
jgi:hypothetical protein